MAANSRVKIGFLVWPQYTDWKSLMDTGVLAEKLGFDHLWEWDHLYAISGSHEGPIFEGYMTLAGPAQASRGGKKGR